MLQQPLKQLEYLLAPCGILTFTTGNEKEGSFLQKRYGCGESEFVRKAFVENLHKLAQAKIAIIGVPSDNGAGFTRGSKLAPLAIREEFLEVEGLYDRLEYAGIIDVGDVRDHPLLIDDSMYKPWVIRKVRQARWGNLGAEADRLDLPVSPHSILRRAMACIYEINPQIKILMIGGDHSLSIVPIEVLCREGKNFDHSLGIIHLDAHTDLLHTREGLPFSYATWAWYANDLLGRGGRLVQFGIRVSGKNKASWEEQLNIKQYWSSEIVAAKPDDMIQAILDDFYRAHVEKIYISSDIDGLSPAYASATGTCEKGGLNPTFVRNLYIELSRHFPIVGSDLVEVAPTLSRGVEGEPKRTLQSACYLLFAQMEAMLSHLLPFSSYFKPPQPVEENLLPKQNKTDDEIEVIKGSKQERAWVTKRGGEKPKKITKQKNSDS